MDMIIIVFKNGEKRIIKEVTAVACNGESIVVSTLDPAEKRFVTFQVDCIVHMGIS